MYTINDLRQGKVALRNDGTLQMLEDVLRYAFPNDNTPIRPYWKYLYFMKGKKGWECTDSMPSYSACQSIQLFIDEIAKERHIVIINDSIEKSIRDLKMQAKEIGLDCEIIFKQRKK